MTHTAFGRRLYAIGGNEQAARTAGVNVVSNKRMAFALCATLAAITGMLMASRLGSAQPTGGDGLFLPAYAAVFLGMTMFKEGVPNIWETFIGAAILGIIENGLTILEVPTFLQDVIQLDCDCRNYLTKNGMGSDRMKLTNPFINQRNKQIWQQSQQKQETLLIGFLLAGDPSPKESLQTIKQAFIAGMDILELGIPSEKPKLDGEVIQRGHARVLKTQTGTDWLVDYCTRLRAKPSSQFGQWAIVPSCIRQIYTDYWQKKLIDALLIPDCSLAEQKQIAEVVQPLGVDVARFVHNSMTDAEMRTICQDANFIYAQSYPGKTGQSDIILSN